MVAVKPPKMNPEQEHIFNFIIEKIIDRSLKIGERIPTEMELAKLFKTNRMNSHKALNHLENIGLITRNRKGGTTVAGFPNSFTIGEMRKKVRKIITVLDPLPAETKHLHWNPEISSIIAEELERHGAQMDYIDVSRVANAQELSEYFRQSAHSGACALLFISYGKFNGMLENSPEMFFHYQRNIYIYARDAINWSAFPYNIVSVDLFNEGVLAGEYSLRKNCQKIFYGITQSHRNNDWLKTRRDGLQCALKRSSAFTGELKDISLDGSLGKIYKCIEAGEKIMLVCTADIIAAGFIDRIREEKGFLPGKDYSLLSFNNDSRFKKYGLTTIAPPLAEIGRTLAQLIGASITGKDDRTSYIKIKSNIIEART